MRQNVFMTSMYFFIPLKKLGCAASKEYLYRKWTTIAPPSYLKNSEAYCEYTSWDFNNDNRFYFYRSRAMEGHNHPIRMVELKAFLVRYRQKKCQNEYSYYFVIGISIDKLFLDNPAKPTQNIKCLLCTQNDLVFLKRAFYETSDQGLFYPDNSRQLEFHPWLDQTVAWILGKKTHHVVLKYSIIDIVGLDVDDKTWTTKADLDNAFSKRYYDHGVQNLSNELKGHSRRYCNIERFAYGLIYGNDNFYRVPSTEYKKALGGGYSNNRSEITYAGHDTILTIRSHHSFHYEPTNTKRLHLQCDELRNVQNVMEICDVIKTRLQMCFLRHSLNTSDAAQIQDTLLAIAKEFNSSLFHLEELDRKIDFIYRALGLNKEFDELRQMSALASDSAKIKTDRIRNRFLTFLSVATVLLTLIQVIQNFPSKYQETMCNCNCNDSVTIQLDSSTLSLFLMIVILIGVVLLLINQYCNCRKAKNRRIIDETDCYE